MFKLKSQINCFILTTMNSILSFYKNTFFRVFFKNNVKYCSNKATISFKSYF